MSAKRSTREQLERAKDRLSRIMTEHVGPNNKIGMGELYERVFDRPFHHRINDTRNLRKIILEMRNDGIPIVSNSSNVGGGYWLAASASEINKYCEKGKRQAVGMLTRIAKLKKISLPEYLGQMQLELEARNGQ